MDLDKGTERATEEELFLERLQTLYDRNLAELQTFAQREKRSFEEVRQRVGEWHCRYLFDFSSDQNSSLEEKIFTILQSTSRTLESLENTAHLQSFFLVVNPNDPKDEGFLGGTMLGREWWRGHRGCGATGASAFKAYCNKAHEHQAQKSHAHTVWPSPSQLQSYAPPTASKPGAKLTAPALKSEIYSSIRSALRAVSGHRTAEMKWTAHSKLDAYGVRLEGWPADVPMTNPSSMSSAQMQRVLSALQSDALRFVGLGAATPPAVAPHAQESVFDISWACGDEQRDPGPAQASVLQAEQAANAQAEDPSTRSREATPASSFVISAYAGSSSAGDGGKQQSKKRPREDT